MFNCSRAASACLPVRIHGSACGDRKNFLLPPASPFLLPGQRSTNLFPFPTGWRAWTFLHPRHAPKSASKTNGGAPCGNSEMSFCPLAVRSPVKSSLDPLPSSIFPNLCLCPNRSRFFPPTPSTPGRSSRQFFWCVFFCRFLLLFIRGTNNSCFPLSCSTASLRSRHLCGSMSIPGCSSHLATLTTRISFAPYLLKIWNNL